MNIFFRRSNPRGNCASTKSAVKVEQSEPEGNLERDRVLAKIPQDFFKEKDEKQKKIMKKI